MIYETNESFDFGKNIHYLSPKSIPGGNYFIKCQSPGNNPLYIQTPKCISKQKLVKTGKKMYGDLVFTQDDESFLKWMEEFEAHCQKTLFDNKAEWFDSELEMHDIENSFAASLKIYKSGKQHVLRANIPMRLGKCALKIYDEQEQDIDADTIVENTPIITVLEIQGIRCSSRSFQLEYEIKQMLVLNPVDIFDKCVLLSKTKEKPSSLMEDGNGLVKKAEVLPLVKEEEKKIGEGKSIEDTSREIQEEKTKEETKEKEEKDLGIPLEKDKTNILEAIDLILPEDSSETETIQLKKRNEVYFEMYREAKRKAKMAREFALSAYLEAKRIKNTYLIDEALDSDDEIEEDPGKDLEERGNDE